MIPFELPLTTAVAAVTPISKPSDKPSSSLSASIGLVSSPVFAWPSAPRSSAPSAIPSSSVSASRGLVSPALKVASLPTSSPSSIPSPSVSAEFGSVPSRASCALDRPSLSGSAAESSPAAFGFVESCSTSMPSSEPPLSVSVSKGFVLPMPFSGPVAFTSSPSDSPSPSVSAWLGSVSPAPVLVESPIVLVTAPSPFESSTPSFKPSLSLSALAGLVVLLGSVSATKFAEPVSVPL